MNGADNLLFTLTFPLAIFVCLRDGSAKNTRIIIPGVESPGARALVVVGTAVVIVGFAELWDNLPFPFVLFAVAMMGVESASRCCVYIFSKQTPKANKNEI